MNQATNQLHEKSTSCEASQDFPAFYGTQRFITIFTTAHYVSLSRAKSIQAMPLPPTTLKSISIISSHLCLDGRTILKQILAWYTMETELKDRNFEIYYAQIKKG